MVRGSGFIGVVVTVVALVPATAASAATRYASPAGATTGTCDSAAAACTVSRAVGVAQPGDDVSVAAGDYTISTSLPILGAITVHGAPASRPRLLTTGTAIVEVGNGATLRDVEVIVNAPAASPYAVYAHDATVDRVAIANLGNSTAGWAYGLVASGATSVTNSLLRAKSSGGMGFHAWAGNVSLRNVTVVGAAAMRAYYARPSGSAYADGNVTLDIRNSVFRAAGAGFDGEAYGDTGTAGITVDFSNFRSFYASPGGTVTPGPNNQNSSAPLFVDGANGNFRQAPGSPTIDSGSGGAVGQYDLDGNLRSVGAGPDLGAYELIGPPTATTLAPSAVAQTTATLTGSALNAGGGATWRIVYGPTAAYGSATTAQSLPASASAQNLAADVSGLSPSTAYHYRLEVTNAAGTVNGADQTFTTTAAPVSDVPAAPVDSTAPVLSLLQIRPTALRPLASGGSIAPNRGARVAYSLSEAAITTFTVERVVQGTRSKGRCVKPRPGLRGKRCKRFVLLRGKFIHADSAGVNRFRFTGRLGGRALPRGTYRLIATPADAAGNKGRRAVAGFRIVG